MTAPPLPYCIPGQDCYYCHEAGDCELEKEYIADHLSDPMYINKSDE